MAETPPPQRLGSALLALSAALKLPSCGGCQKRAEALDRLDAWMRPQKRDG